MTSAQATRPDAYPGPVASDTRRAGVGHDRLHEPEQARDGPAVDHRSDLFRWASCSTKWPLAACRLRHRRWPSQLGVSFTPNPSRSRDSNTAFRPSSIASCKCLEKDVERRYQSAPDLQVDLRQAETLIRARHASSSSRTSRRHNLLGQLTTSSAGPGARGVQPAPFIDASADADRRWWMRQDAAGTPGRDRCWSSSGTASGSSISTPLSDADSCPDGGRRLGIQAAAAAFADHRVPSCPDGSFCSCSTTAST